MLYSDSDSVRLISRDGNTFKSFPDLCKGLVRDLNGRRCILDGEIVCLDSHGQPQFRKWIGREELFERERATHPNWHYWDACALVTDQNRQTASAGSGQTALLCLGFSVVC